MVIFIFSKLSFEAHIFTGVKTANLMFAISKRVSSRCVFWKLLYFWTFTNNPYGLNMNLQSSLESATQETYKIIEKSSNKALVQTFTRLDTGLRKSNYGERLRKLDLTSLKHRRRRGTRIEILKMGYNRYDPKATKGLFEISNRTKIKKE